MPGGTTARTLAPSKEAFDAPLSPPPLDDEPGPATGRSGAYPDGTLTRWSGPAFRTQHGGIVVFDDTVELGRMARFAMEFCAEESCGKCTPCRVGSVRGMEILDRISRGEDREANLALLEDLCETMAEASLCAMGGLTPMPIRSILEYFPDSLIGTTLQGRS